MGFSEEKQKEGESLGKFNLITSSTGFRAKGRGRSYRHLLHLHERINNNCSWNGGKRRGGRGKFPNPAKKVSPLPRSNPQTSGRRSHFLSSFPFSLFFVGKRKEEGRGGEEGRVMRRNKKVEGEIMFKEEPRDMSTIEEGSIFVFSLYRHVSHFSISVGRKRRPPLLYWTNCSSSASRQVQQGLL